jgi:hypothetical protein
VSPPRSRSPGSPSAEPPPAGQGRGEQNFSRTEHQKFFPDAPCSITAAKLGGAKLTGRKVEHSHAEDLTLLGHTREEAVFLCAKLRIGRRAGCDDPRHLALHECLGYARVLHLLADGDLEPLTNQLGNVVLGGVIRHPAHGDGGTFFLVARGQRDLQLFGRHYSVFKEQLVEIT